MILIHKEMNKSRSWKVYNIFETCLVAGIVKRNQQVRDSETESSKISTEHPVATSVISVYKRQYQ